MAPIPITVIYDGNCSFCQRFVAWLRKNTRTPLVFIPYQQLNNIELSERVPRTTDLEAAVHVQDSEGQWSSAAHAVWLLLAHSRIPLGKSFLKLYNGSKLFKYLSDRAYSYVASNRSCKWHGTRSN